jgi:hypothetical protein
MKLKLTLHATALLVCLLAVPGPVRADQAPSRDGKRHEPKEARTLLEAGQASNSLPEGMVIRLGACLGESAVGASGDCVPDELHETWEFASDQEGDPSDADRIVWGRVVKGLQLGISPLPGTNGVAAAVFDGSTLQVQVHLRNAGKSPVRFLASTYGCLAFGPDGAIPVSKLILTPKTGGAPLAITYQGVNHLRLLDKRRPKSEGWQETLFKASGGGEDLQWDAKEVESWTTLLAPGQTLRAYLVDYTPGEDSDSVWQQTGKSNLVPEGKYQLQAVFTVNQKVSPWKGELTSGALEVEIHPSNKK